LLVASVLAAAGQLLFKIGASGRASLIAFFNPYIFTGLVLYGLGTIIWIYVLAREQLVHVFAFTALSFVLVYAGAVLLLGERMAIGGAIGVAFVLAGLFLITQYGR
jgi:drug/metabolite transporter (DMT)-like permease